MNTIYRTLFISKAEKTLKYLQRYNYDYINMYYNGYYNFIISFENEKRQKTFERWYFKDTIIEKR